MSGLDRCDQEPPVHHYTAPNADIFRDGANDIRINGDWAHVTCPECLERRPEAPTLSGRVGIEDAAAVAEVKPATIRKWVQRGYITRYSDGFDLGELLARVDARNVGKAIGAVIASHRRDT